MANALPSPPTKRVVSVDALRGLVMIIMALDHTRDFFHNGAMSFSPVDLARTNSLFFFTRWITHFCAPVFMFTAGLAAWFWLQRPGRSRGALSRYLVTRGLWLVLLELTVFHFLLFLSLTKGPVLLVTLWALGCSMIALAALIHMPVRMLAVLSVAVILLHNLADRFQNLGSFWNILHQQGLVSSPIPGLIIVSGYPLIPWIFVMSAGYCFGALVMTLAPEARRKAMLRIGAAATALFFILRGINIYGDLRPWTSEFAGKTVLSFFNVTKNPPSLDFVLMTLGPALMLLAWFETMPRMSARNPLLVYGRAPLFYFVCHFALLVLLTFPFTWFRYGTVSFLLTDPIPSVGGSSKLYPPDFGYDMWVVYLLWAGVVAAMYWPSVWWRERGRRRA